MPRNWILVESARMTGSTDLLPVGFNHLSNTDFDRFGLSNHWIEWLYNPAATHHSHIQAVFSLCTNRQLRFSGCSIEHGVGDCQQTNWRIRSGRAGCGLSHHVRAISSNPNTISIRRITIRVQMPVQVELSGWYAQPSSLRFWWWLSGFGFRCARKYSPNDTTLLGTPGTSSSPARVPVGVERA